MKIKVTYEEADLKQLIRVDLARQSIIATDADIHITKAKAEVSVDVSRDDSALTEPAPNEPSPTPAQRNQHTHDVMTQPSVGRPPAPPVTPLEVIEGGNSVVDMSSILGASQRLERSNEGKFPKAERQLMEGESFDFPGDKA